MIYTGEGLSSPAQLLADRTPITGGRNILSRFIRKYRAIWTWDQVRRRSMPCPVRLERGKVPGRFKMWQASGDRLILPGSAKPIDVDVYPGDAGDPEPRSMKSPVPDPFVEEHRSRFTGVEYHKVRRFNSHCYVAVIDPAGKPSW